MTLPSANPDGTPAGLAALEARLRQDLDWLGWPAKQWMPARAHEGQPPIDVAIVHEASNAGR